MDQGSLRGPCADLAPPFARQQPPQQKAEDQERELSAYWARPRLFSLAVGLLARGVAGALIVVAFANLRPPFPTTALVALH